MRQSGFALDWMQFKSEGSDIVQGTYALGTGFQLGVLDGLFCYIDKNYYIFNVYEIKSGWAYMTHSGQLTPFMSEMRSYPELQLATFTINNGPVNLYDSPYGHPYLHEEIFKIMIGMKFFLEIDIVCEMYDVNVLVLKCGKSFLTSHVFST